MSRNYELLQNLGKAEQMLDTPDMLPAAQGLEPPLAIPPHNSEVSPSPLTMEEEQREQVAKLVQRLFLLPSKDAARAVVFSGSEPGNGCSWICARAAEILAAHVSGSVCIVDANLRSPSLHQHFGVENHHGLAESLSSSEPLRSFVQPVGRKNLWLLSCGAETENGQALLGSDRMRARIAELRSQVDYVLVDAPAITLGNDAVSLALSVDGLVLVLKANSSRRDSVRKAVQDLGETRVQVLGAVLNQRTFPIPQKLYSRL